MTKNWIAGVSAGFVGAIVTGVIVQFGFDPRIISESVPAVIGQSGTVIGWIVFIILGILLGVIYAIISSVEPIGSYADNPESGSIVGLGYGLVLWIVAVILVPLVVGGVSPQFGQYALTVRAGLAYVLFGIVIGILYGLFPVSE